MMRLLGSTYNEGPQLDAVRAENLDGKDEVKVVFVLWSIQMDIGDLNSAWRSIVVLKDHSGHAGEES